MLSKEELESARATADSYRFAVRGWHAMWHGNSDSKDSILELMRIAHKFYVKSLKKRSHLQSYIHLKDEGDGAVIRVTEAGPDSVDVVTCSHHTYATRVRQYRLCKEDSEWRIDQIIDTVPMSPSAESLPLPYDGTWVSPSPQRIRSQPPVIDLEETFRFMRGKGKEAIRLHPQPRARLDPLCSKIGGAIAWPAEESYPRCPERGCAAVPVLQLRREDVPILPFKSGTNLLQLLWFPQHYFEIGPVPRLLLYWRDSSTLSRDHVLSPSYDLYDHFYVVKECQINPEIITEYPYFDTLSEEQQNSFTTAHKRHSGHPLYDYRQCLSTAPGFKAGGYPRLSASCQYPRVDYQMGDEEIQLIALDSREWINGAELRWRPQTPGDSLQNPTGITLLRAINVFVNTTTWTWRAIATWSTNP